MRSIAIVGSGPSGVFCAEALLRTAPDSRIDVIDRLPTPFGLVRFGVAPDHQSTKSVTRLFDRVLAKPEVAFIGGVELERDVSLDELRAAYDAVVIATGAAIDRRLDIPGEDLAGVFTSGRFVGWYNHHPDHAEVDLETIANAVVVGSGNVALDVARLLVKSEAEFAGSDLSPEVTAAFAQFGIERVCVIGRSPASAMKFSEAEILEFGELERARPKLGFGGAAVESGGADAAGKSTIALRTITAKPYEPKPLEIVFEFGLRPVAFEGDGRLARVRFVDQSGVEHVREAGLAVTCIGYATHGHGLPMRDGALVNDDGRIDDGLYVVGWAKRGPSGTIPTNRSEAQLVAKKIIAETADGAKPGREALLALLAEREVGPTDYAAWRRIDVSEIARAHESRTRTKWRSHDELRAAAAAEPVR